MGAEGFLGFGHEKWDGNRVFVSREELDTCINSMISKGIKTGVQLEGDPGKGEIKRRVISVLSEKEFSMLTPTDVANEIERQVSDAAGGKTTFVRPKSLS
jgi:hypothetical protein